MLESLSFSLSPSAPDYTAYSWPWQQEDKGEDGDLLHSSRPCRGTIPTYAFKILDNLSPPHENGRKAFLGGC